MMTEETARVLDKLYAEVHEMHPHSPLSSDFARAFKQVGYGEAILDVLALIGDLGGMSPADRAAENGQFGVGA